MDTSARLTALIIALLVGVSSLILMPQQTAATESSEPPPYKLRPFELRDLVYDELSWTNEPPQLLPAYPPFDKDGIPLFRWTDGKLYYRPGGLAINGMKRIDAYRDTGNVAQLEQALKQAKQLRKMKLVRHDAWWLPFWFDYAPEGLRGPWFNAMGQGLVLSFFVRLYRVTGDAVHLNAAGKVFESFLRLGRGRTNGPRAWVAYVAERDYLWLEHYPNGNPDHVLNAHLHAMIGIYEYWQQTRSPEARQVLEGSLTTMRDIAGRYRREGRVSIYGLRSRTNILKYHRIHVWQLRLLGRMTGDRYFTELGNALAKDASVQGYVAGRPAAQRHGAAIGSARLKKRIAPYPFVMPAMDRAA